MAYAKATDWGSFLSEINDDSGDQGRALGVAASERDAVFRSVLSTVVPIDFSALTAGIVRTELEEHLRLINLRIAADYLTTGSSAAGKKVARDAEWARKQLTMIGTEKMKLPLVSYEGIGTANAVEITRV